MHYSAKRGIEIACRPSVRPSVCDVGGPEPHTRLEVGWEKAAISLKRVKIEEKLPWMACGNSSTLF